MQLPLTRDEIVELMRSLMGQQTTVAVSAINQGQFLAAINTAYLKAVGDCSWVSVQSRTTADVGAEQYLIPYPTDCAPGSVLEVAIADPADGKYRQLKSTFLPAAMDFDLIVTLGGDDFDAIQGEPEYYQQRGDGIFLYPPNDDTARKLRIVAQKRVRFTTGGQSSLCDGELIAYWALAIVYGDHDPQQRAWWQGMYADRLATLRGWQHTGETIKSRDDAPVLDDRDGMRPVPNYDTRPRT